jgi:WD40 repeat protein
MSSDEPVAEALQYKIFLRLQGEHSQNITSIAFSPDGHYIACGGDDRKLSVWDAFSGESLHVLSGASTISCLSWLNSNQVVGGMGNGGLACATIDKVVYFIQSTPS